MAFLIIKIDQVKEIKLKLRCKINFLQLIYSQIRKHEILVTIVYKQTFL